MISQFCLPAGGEMARADLGYTPIDTFAHLRIRNTYGRTAKVYLDGRFVGNIGPSDARTFDLDPGRTSILVTGPHGEVLYSRTLSLRRGENLRVDAQGGPLAMW